MAFSSPTSMAFFSPAISSKVTINGNTIDLDPCNPDALAQYYSGDSKHTNYVYIQCNAPLTSDLKDQLRSLDVEIQSFVDYYTLLCRYMPTSLEPLRRLAFVVHANCYHMCFKTDKILKDLRDDGKPVELLVELHEGAACAQEVLEEIALIPGAEDYAVASSTHIVLKAPRPIWSEIEKVDDVKSISLRVPMALHNDLARVTVGLDGGLQIPLSQSKYNGAGELITLADTGLDLGDRSNVHPFFRHCDVHLQTAATLDPSEHPDIMADRTGHGTHTAASAVGSGICTLYGSPVVVTGTAPGASLIVQTINDTQGKMIDYHGDRLAQVFFQPAYDHGSRIHNNSWGAIPLPYQLPYNDWSAAADAFVWNHPDFVILMSAGNDNGRLGFNGRPLQAQIGGFASAKNCITVGASQSSRPTDGSRVLGSVGTPMDTFAPWWSSSIGPTLEGRMKPDVVAPGTMILSASSRHQDSDPSGYGRETGYKLYSGTSCATPLVAGCVAVVRQALLAEDPTFRNPSVPASPSAALLKALLIHYAIDLKGSRTVTHPGKGAYQVDFQVTPNHAYGYGRVSVPPILQAIDHYNSSTGKASLWSGYRDVSLLMSVGHNYAFSLNPPAFGANDEPHLKVTLVYLTPAGCSMQHWLTLGVSYNPRQVDSIFPGRSPDTVQQVICQPPADRRVDITVVANLVLKDKDDQKFAVVWNWQRGPF